jgi:hypothetical protein
VLDVGALVESLLVEVLDLMVDRVVLARLEEVLNFLVDKVVLALLVEVLNFLVDRMVLDLLVEVLNFLADEVVLALLVEVLSFLLVVGAFLVSLPRYIGASRSTQFGIHILHCYFLTYPNHTTLTLTRDIRLFLTRVTSDET